MYRGVGAACVDEVLCLKVCWSAAYVHRCIPSVKKVDVVGNGVTEWGINCRSGTWYNLCAYACHVWVIKRWRELWLSSFDIQPPPAF